MFYVIIKHVWPLESFWPPRWYILSPDAFKRQIDLQLYCCCVILKKSVARVKCIWQSADIKHEQVCEQNLIFPFVRSRLCVFGCRTENSFAVAVGRKGENGKRNRREIALSFVVVSHFASLRSIKRHFLFVCKKLLV